MNRLWHCFWRRKFTLDIPRCIEWCAIATSDNRPTPSLDDIVAADQWARQEVLTASKLIVKRGQSLGVRGQGSGKYSDLKI